MDIIALIKSGNATVNGQVSKNLFDATATMQSLDINNGQTGLKSLPESASHVVREKKRFKNNVKEDENRSIKEIVDSIIEDTPGVKKVTKEMKKIAKIIQDEQDAIDTAF